MDNQDLINKIKFLEEELERTKLELIETKEHLKKYTAPSYKKIYYENNKEEIIKKVKEHKEKTNYQPSPEQKKEWARRAYLKKKEKLLLEKENISKNI